MRLVAVWAVLVLSACGVDGPPVPKDTGIEVTGTAKIGVRGSL